MVDEDPFSWVPTWSLPGESYERLPGLFQRHLCSEVLRPGFDYRMEPAGYTEDGTPLYMMFRKKIPRDLSMRSRKKNQPKRRKRRDNPRRKSE